MNRRLFVITTIISSLVVLTTSVLLFTSKVGSFSFLNRSGSCTPYNVFVEKGNSDYSVVISWYTHGKCVGYVNYGLDIDRLDRVGVDISEKGSSNSHRVVLDKLVTKQSYYYLINSNGVKYGNNNIPLEFILESL